MVGMAQRFPRFSDRRFPVFCFPYTVYLTTYEKDFSLRSKWRCGGAASWGCALAWQSSSEGFSNSKFPVFRSSHIHRFPANEKDFSLCSKWRRGARLYEGVIEMSLYYIYTISIGAVKRHRISALFPESRTHKADALPGGFTSIIYVYNIFPYAYSMKIG